MEFFSYIYIYLLYITRRVHIDLFMQHTNASLHSFRVPINCNKRNGRDGVHDLAARMGIVVAEGRREQENELDVGSDGPIHRCRCVCGECTSYSSRLVAAGDDLLRGKEMENKRKQLNTLDSY